MPITPLSTLKSVHASIMESPGNEQLVYNHEEDVYNFSDVQQEHSDEEDSEDEDSEPEFDCEPVRKKCRLDYSTIHPALEKPRISNSFRDLAISVNAGRGRRPGTLQAAIKGFSTGYVDQDTSGTYDPKHTRATPPPTPISRPIRARAQSNTNGQPSTNKRKRVGYALPVTLTLTSKKGLDYLGSLPKGPYSSMNGEVDEPSDEEHDSGHSSPANKLRRSRRAKTVTVHSINEAPEDSSQAQGCKGCLQIGETECCVIRNKYSWPCDACADAGIECEMIIPFEFKTGCLRCKRKRTKCQFRDDGGKGVDRCSSCEEADEPCITGPLPKALESKYRDLPPSQTVTARPSGRKLKTASKEISLSSISPTPEPDPALPERLYVSCNQCRETGGRCTLKRGRNGPCSNCKRAGESCKFVHMPTRIHFGSTNLSGANGQTQRRFPADCVERSRPHSYEDNTRQIFSEILNKKKYNTTKGKPKPKSKHRSNSRIVPSIPKRPRAKLIGTTSGIQHITITTSFCHPIRFHYVPDPENLHPCSWCDSPVFGLWGHSLKEVEVIPYGKNGNEEICGGHAEDGVEQTKMCCNCTLDRMTIMYCDGHSMKPIEGLDPKTLDLGAIGQSLVALAQEDHAGAELVKRVKWCNICVAPAEYTCNSQGEGCGMHLCQTCNDLLTRLQKSWTGSVGLNLMDELVKLWKADLWKRGDMGELRADAEFLLTTGELSVRLNLGMEMSSFEDGQNATSKEGNAGQSFGSSQGSQGSTFSTNEKGKESQNTPYSGSSSQNNSFQHLTHNSSSVVRALPQTPRPQKVPGSFGSSTTPTSSRPNSSSGVSLSPNFILHQISSLDMSHFNKVFPNQYPESQPSSSGMPEIATTVDRPTSAPSVGPRKFTITSSPRPTFDPATTSLHAQARANASTTAYAKFTRELVGEARSSYLPQTTTATKMQFMNAMNATANAKKKETARAELPLSARRPVEPLSVQRQEIMTPLPERSRVNAVKAMDIFGIYDDEVEDDEEINGQVGITRSVSSSSVATMRSSASPNNLLPIRQSRKISAQRSPSIDIFSSVDNNNAASHIQSPNMQNLVKSNTPPAGFRFLDEVDVEMEMSGSISSSRASSPGMSRAKKSRKRAPTNLRFLDEVDVEMEMSSPHSNYSRASSPTVGSRAIKPQRLTPTNLQFLDEVDVEMHGSHPGSRASSPGMGHANKPQKPAPNGYRFVDEVDVDMEMGPKRVKEPATHVRFLDEVDARREVGGWRERKQERIAARGNRRWDGVVPVGTNVIELGGESEDDDSDGGVRLSGGGEYDA